MSAKQRQETLVKFGQPVQEEIATDNASEGALSRGERPGRAVRSKSAGYDDEGSDFADGGAQEDEDDITNSDDNLMSREKSKTARQAKARAKGKGKATASSPMGSSTLDNPKVMLISLKAGALGLNLTVANNVYL
jgi:SWI/SNF-related matrix-associated actin-dependent regulator of chromatin subfamily A3